MILFASFINQWRVRQLFMFKICMSCMEHQNLQKWVTRNCFMACTRANALLPSAWQIIMINNILKETSFGHIWEKIIIYIAMCHILNQCVLKAFYILSWTFWIQDSLPLQFPLYYSVESVIDSQTCEVCTLLPQALDSTLAIIHEGKLKL